MDYTNRIPSGIDECYRSSNRQFAQPDGHRWARGVARAGRQRQTQVCAELGQVTAAPATTQPEATKRCAVNTAKIFLI